MEKDLFTDIELDAGDAGQLTSEPAAVERKPRKPKVVKPRKRPAHKRRKKAQAKSGPKKRVVWVDRPTYQPLTPAEVDPEFTGTAIEWTDKYGHVQALTGEQYATDRFNAWTANLRILVKAGRNADWPKVDHDWLRSPSPHFIGKMTEALDYLRPIIAEAEALLARAKAVEGAKRSALLQPDAESLPTG
jgi:hypothetical protein